jgi:nucleotide-binding universal stress UspA family protein
MDTPPAVRLHLVVGYDGSPPASRALEGAVRLLAGRDGRIVVVYVGHVPGLDMLSADAIAQMEADFGEIADELRAAVAKQLGASGVAWEFQQRQGLIAGELAAAATAIGDDNPGDTTVILVGSSSRASHRILGSVAVSLARHCPVPLVIVP